MIATSMMMTPRQQNHSPPTPPKTILDMASPVNRSRLEHNQSTELTPLTVALNPNTSSQISKPSSQLHPELYFINKLYKNFQSQKQNVFIYG
jgi:hypothetical protein